MKIPSLGNLSRNSKISILSGAGMSAESGISTFRDNGGLWEQYDIYQVATPEAWRADPQLVLRFYNERRKQLLNARPNAAHYALSQLEQHFPHTHIITQNIDDLHERAGSRQVLHLHGELRKSRSCADENLVYDIEGDSIAWGEKCEKGSQLRPHVVWFGEAVPMIEKAAEIIAQSDLLLVIGTSLNVYPAAGLLHHLPPGREIICIDPAELDLSAFPHSIHWRMKAGEGVKLLVEKMLQSAT